MSFTKLLSDYTKKNNLSPELLKFVFKGGVTMKMLYQKYLKISKPENKKILLELQNYFKRSDSDYGLFIDKKGLTEDQYNDIFYDITKICFNHMELIRKFLEENHDYFLIPRFLLMIS